MRISKDLYSTQISIISLFIGFIACGLFNQYFPSLRYLSVLITFVFLLLVLLKAIHKLRLPSEQVVILFITLALVQLIFNNARTAPADFSLFLAIMLGLLLKNNITSCARYIAIVNVSTVVIMLYELSTFSYLIDQLNNKFEFGRLQGLFSNSKEAGYYTIAATYYLFSVKRLTRLSMLALISIATLSGTRTAILFILVVVIVQVVASVKIRIAKGIIKNFMLSAFMLTLLGYILTKYYFVDKSAYMLVRIYNAFNFESSSHKDRLFFWKSYLEEINNYNWYEIFFGAGTKINIILGNGAESYYLMILSQYGLITLTAIISIFILIFIKLKNYDEKIIFVSLLAILLVGRIGIGWSDGILIWAVFFYTLDSKKRDKIRAT